MNDVKTNKYITKRFINAHSLSELKNDLQTLNISGFLRLDVSDPIINYDY